MSIGPNGYPLCERGHERSPDNVSKHRKCKACCREDSKRHYEANKEKVAESNKRYREANKANRESYKAQRAEYSAANKIRIAEYNREYHQLNREKIIERKRIYDKNNPMVARLKCHKRRASGGKLSLDLADKLLALQKGKCRICKARLARTKYHLDHIVPLSKGGLNTDSNIQLLCPPCNMRKNAKLPHVFAQELGLLFL